MQGRNLIVKMIPAFVEPAAVQLQGMRDKIRIHRAQTAGLRRIHALLEQVEQTARIAIGITDQGVDGRRFKRDTRRRVLYRAVEQLP